MIVNNKKQVFNLFDTNGRRNDTINAYKIYCDILSHLYEDCNSENWGNYPNEQTQFMFYKNAIEASPEIFKEHPIYDNFVKVIKQDKKIENAFLKGDLNLLKKDSKLKKLYENLSREIEGRARHYSSNLVKIGLADEKRKLSMIGKTWISNNKFEKSKFEKLLPIDDTNLIFLRQLLKLRVYTKEHDKYYSPMVMAIYILLKKPRISEDLFITIVQMINPYESIDDTKSFIDDILTNMDIEKTIPYIKKRLDKIENIEFPMSDESLEKYFINQKSKTATEVYKEFYRCLSEFNNNNNKENLMKLIKLFSDNKKKNMLIKAFGYGKKLFEFDKKDSENIDKFLKMNKGLQLFNNNEINSELLFRFQMSKLYDSIREYGDVTKRVMKVTGIISFKNGVVELAYHNLWESFFENINLDKLIFGKADNVSYDDYEKKKNSYFLTHHTIEEIFEYNNENAESLINKLKIEFNLSNENEIKEKIYNDTSNQFIKYIEANYPKEKILKILPLFGDRKNDSKIQDMVAKNTDVPTIFEYIVGIAWYHISAEKFDLFSSFNLSMSADFEPETHAGGGTGDIVINYKDYILMIEVTMMNKQAQKRGEWEPVLRHATNLTIESSPKEVLTLFIADELDENTINIWRAVATVPLKSSRSDDFARSVTIMPLKNEEIIKMLEDSKTETELLVKVKESFGGLRSNFDIDWRKKILQI